MRTSLAALILCTTIVVPAAAEIPTPAETFGHEVGADRKLIPYPRGLQRELNRAVGPWIVDLYRRHPSLVAGPAYWSISPAVGPLRPNQSPRQPPRER